MTLAQIEALIEAVHRAVFIPTGVGGQQVGAGMGILRLKLRDAEISDLHELLSDARRVAIAEANVAVRREIPAAGKGAENV